VIHLTNEGQHRKPEQPPELERCGTDDFWSRRLVCWHNGSRLQKRRGTTSRAKLVPGRIDRMLWKDQTLIRVCIDVIWWQIFRRWHGSRLDIINKGIGNDCPRSSEAIAGEKISIRDIPWNVIQVLHQAFDNNFRCVVSWFMPKEKDTSERFDDGLD